METFGMFFLTLSPLFAVSTVIATFLVWWIWTTLNWVWLTPKRIEKRLKQQGFKGNSYRLLIGDMRDMIKMSKEAKSKPMDPHSNDISPRVLPFLVHTVAKHGKNSFMWLGPKPRLIIMDPDKIKEMANRIYEFQKPETSVLVKLLTPGIVSYDGDKWVKHRKIVNPAFNVEKLKLLVPIFCQCFEDMINKWESVLSSFNGSCELDVWPFIRNVSSDIFARAGFGISYEEGRKIFELQKEMFQLTMILLKFSFIPGYRFLPTYTNRRMKAINKEIQALLVGVINRRLNAMNAGLPTNNDLLSTFLESNSKESGKNNNGGGMSFMEVVEEVKLFYFAGHETTSELLVWTLLLLSKHHDWQVKAREEVFKVLGNEKPDYDKLGQLKIVSMIIQESLRLYPPAIMLPRYLRKDTELGNFSIPAGTELLVPVPMLHQDKELWGDDASEFKPERFSEGVSKATKGKVSYLPFGWGPRICTGQNFSLFEAKIALSMILQHFSLEFSPLYSHAPSFLITLQPEHGTHIILHKL